MCGRYTLSLFDHPMLAPVPEEWRRPTWNQAPGTPALVLGRDRQGALSAQRLWWGFQPPWMTGSSGRRPPINARSETVAESPLFRTAFAQHRCLVPADGFYEWQARKHGKQPWFIRPADGELVFFAGLFTRLTPDHPGGEFGFAVLTTAAGDDVRPLHDRQPVILRETAARFWLDPAQSSQDLLAQCRPSRTGELTRWPVSSRVNRPANDEPAMIDPIDE